MSITVDRLAYRNLCSAQDRHSITPSVWVEARRGHTATDLVVVVEEGRIGRRSGEDEEREEQTAGTVVVAGQCLYRMFGFKRQICY